MFKFFSLKVSIFSGLCGNPSVIEIGDKIEIGDEKLQNKETKIYYVKKITNPIFAKYNYSFSSIFGRSIYKQEGKLHQVRIYIYIYIYFN